mgnify:CR=1 FL=1
MCSILNLKNHLYEWIKGVLSLSLKIGSNMIGQLIYADISRRSLLQKVLHTSVFVRHSLFYLSPVARSILTAQCNLYSRCRLTDIDICLLYTSDAADEL